MRHAKDLSGLRFGRWNVMFRSDSPNGHARWVVRCDCGTDSVVWARALLSGDSTSCGCFAKQRAAARVIDLVDQQFGKLRVTCRGEPGRRGEVRWCCVCDCGRTTLVAGSSLRRGKTRSCGCLALETAAALQRKHGVFCKGNRMHPLYVIWQGARARCYNRKAPGFLLYGAKGIRMCYRWRRDFLAFVADMGDRPSLEHSIDRIDGTRGYECGRADCDECGPAGRAPNCRWATKGQQARNTSRNVRITLGGVTKSLAEWECDLGFARGLLSGRLSRGWSPERALSEQPQKKLRVVASAPAIRTASHDEYSPLPDGWLW